MTVGRSGSMVGIPMGQPMGTCGGPELMDSPSLNRANYASVVHPPARLEDEHQSKLRSLPTQEQSGISRTNIGVLYIGRYCRSDNFLGHD